MRKAFLQDSRPLRRQVCTCLLFPSEASAPRNRKKFCFALASIGVFASSSSVTAGEEDTKAVFEIETGKPFSPK